MIPNYMYPESTREADDRRDKLLQALSEHHIYITNNKAFIPNYAERHRYDEFISTSFAASVNFPVAIAASAAYWSPFGPR